MSLCTFNIPIPPIPLLIPPIPIIPIPDFILTFSLPSFFCPLD